MHARRRRRRRRRRAARRRAAACSSRRRVDCGFMRKVYSDLFFHVHRRASSCMVKFLSVKYRTTMVFLKTNLGWAVLLCCAVLCFVVLCALTKNEKLKSGGQYFAKLPTRE